VIECIIFDLSEVLISGLLGVENGLARHLHKSASAILTSLGGPLLEELLLGNITEDTYLRAIIEREGWNTDASTLKNAIRRNFRNQVEGMPDILAALAQDHDLVLLSDHAREWIAYIQSIHPFLQLLGRAFFSYELGRLKRDPETFSQVVRELRVPARHCLFIDDNPVNVAAAESAGLRGIRFAGAVQLASELRGWGIM
jgi:HAD superfamily hydrolase (TIGR01509 family)